MTRRRICAWALLLGSPGAAFSTLLLVANAIDGFGGRTPIWAAGALVGVTLMIAVVGTGAGAYLLARDPDKHRFAVVASAFAGMAVYMACVFTAEKVLNWI